MAERADLECSCRMLLSCISPLWKLHKKAHIYATWNWAFNNLLWQNTETNLIFLTHWGLDKMADIFQTIFSSAFSWIKMYLVTIRFSLILVASGPINNTSALVKIMAWRRPGNSYYLNQWWLIYRRIYSSFGPNELMSMFAIIGTGIGWICLELWYFVNGNKLPSDLFFALRRYNISGNSNFPD